MTEEQTERLLVMLMLMQDRTQRGGLSSLRSHISHSQCVCIGQTQAQQSETACERVTWLARGARRAEWDEWKTGALRMCM